MKIRLLSICLSFACFVHAQQNLTVEKIMQDPKWIGTSPSNVFWSTDSKKVYCDWNPDKNISDSVYSYLIGSQSITKFSFLESQMLASRNNGVYNTSRTLLLYTHHGDIFLQDLKSGNITRITQTEETESNPGFLQKDEWVVYLRNQNLYAWSIKSGVTRQLTNFVKSIENAPAHLFSDKNDQEPWLGGHR